MLVIVGLAIVGAVVARLALRSSAGEDQSVDHYEKALETLRELQGKSNSSRRAASRGSQAEIPGHVSAGEGHVRPAAQGNEQGLVQAGGNHDDVGPPERASTSRRESLTPGPSVRVSNENHDADPVGASGAMSLLADQAGNVPAEGDELGAGATQASTEGARSAPRAAEVESASTSAALAPADATNTGGDDPETAVHAAIRPPLVFVADDVPYADANGSYEGVGTAVSRAEDDGDRRPPAPRATPSRRRASASSRSRFAPVAERAVEYFWPAHVEDDDSARAQRGQRPGPPVLIVVLALLLAVLVVVLVVHSIGGSAGTRTSIASVPRRHHASKRTVSTNPPSIIEPTSSDSASATSYYTAPSGSYTVSIVASAACWTALKGTQYGPDVWARTLQPGESKTYSATGPLWVDLGASVGVAITLNGIPVALPPGHPDVYNLSFQPAGTGQGSSSS